MLFMHKTVMGQGLILAGLHSSGQFCIAVVVVVTAYCGRLNNLSNPEPYPIFLRIAVYVTVGCGQRCQTLSLDQ